MMMLSFSLPIQPLLLDLGRFALRQSDDVAASVSAAWDQIWQTSLTGGLYRAIANIGVLIAVVSLSFFVVDFAKKWMQGGNDWALSEVVFPLLVVVLLANGGQNLAQASLGIRNVINYYNNQVLSFTSISIDLQENLESLADYADASSIVAGLRSQCDSIVDQEKLQQCLDLTRQSSEEILALFRQKHGQNAPRWVEALSEQIRVSLSNPTSLIPGNLNLFTSLGSQIGATVLLEGFLIAIQAAFQLLVEVSLLLTALIGPIPVGLSLLPFGAKPLYAWLSGFGALGLCKLSLNLITGLVASVSVQSGPGVIDPMVTAFLLGILAPVLSFAIASGGGFAIFQGISSAAVSAAGAVGGGVSTLARVLVVGR